MKYLKKTSAILLTTLPLALSFSANIGQAKVSGPCSNCHTMHSSQDGQALVQGGPATTLLIDDCVGCHSSNTADTIVDGTPIVYNTVPPDKPLAGGNFHWVAQAGGENDVYGHNVWGISAEDSYITAAEGAPGGEGGTGCKTCHQSLALNPSATDNTGTDPIALGKNGCQGCHIEVSHHDDSNNWFRFLKGHKSANHYVTGIESPNWEQNPTAPENRNVYRGADTDYPTGSGLSSTHSISAFCSGCHTNFHEYMGESSPWIRHPNDILLPTTGEYAGYDPLTTYSNEAPVAYLDPANTIRAEAVVTCLSCHRAHGSDQPDMLRWDYTDMGTGGCYTCHTLKH